MDLSPQKHIRLFNRIALGYQWFFHSQMQTYRRFFKHAVFPPEFILPSHARILDVGCGTGAFGKIFQEEGYQVMGVDAAERMVKRANANDLPTQHANILEGLPFEDQSFDLLIAANVVHGFPQKTRHRIYQEMARLTKQHVLFHDYNPHRNIWVSIIEWIEHGDYFNFIKQIPHDFSTIFPLVKIVAQEGTSSWYLCSTH